MFLQSAGGFGFNLIYFIFERICGHLFHENLRRRLLSDSIVMQPRQQIGGSRRRPNRRRQRHLSSSNWFSAIRRKSSACELTVCVHFTSMFRHVLLAPLFVPLYWFIKMILRLYSKLSFITGDKYNLAESPSQVTEMSSHTVFFRPPRGNVRRFSNVIQSSSHISQFAILCDMPELITMWLQCYQHASQVGK